MPAPPGRAAVHTASDGFNLGNGAITFRYRGKGSALSGWGGNLRIGEPSLFEVTLSDGRKLSSSRLTRVTPYKPLDANTLKNRFDMHGAGVEAVYRDTSSGLRLTCTFLQPDQSHYLRQVLTVTAEKADLPISRLELLSFSLGNAARMAGSVSGSPISNGHYFLGLEHPMAQNTVMGDAATTSIQRVVPLRAGQTVAYSAVLGAESPGQERRSFASYLERERARPYAPFLHYNSWYDLGYFNRFNETECLERIRQFGDELVAKRGVKLSSFLFDDGWDDTSTNWSFNSGFPNGFAPLKAEAKKYGAAPGVWLSPWGGYGKPREERLANGKKNGIEIDSQGFALSGPKYYALFHDVCMRMVTEYGINQFKFDGTGSPAKQVAGSQFDSDFEAAIQLIRDLRVANPSLFVNLTTGTWPSPFWTRYADSIWRGGSDHDFAGVGPNRERWITYRDSDTYHNVVLRGPMYPLNSLMLHGLIYAQHARNLDSDPTGAFHHELLSYFGSGTQLQEMYITPSLLSPANWDDLAKTAKWAAANAEVLRDSHWIGGDPESLNVYGWASWSAKKSVVVLRNPSDRAQAFQLEPKEMLEIPPFAEAPIRFSAAFGETSVKPFVVNSEAGKALKLAPFQVLVLEGRPQ